jgi:hypothetical protein
MNTHDILKLSQEYEITCQQLVKIAIIKKMPDGKYRVLSEKGKNLGTYPSKTQAQKRLKQVEYFKKLDQSEADDPNSLIDLTDIEEFSYSALMRKLRKKASPEQVLLFLKYFKQQFDKAVKVKLQKPEKIALQNSLVAFNKKYKVKLPKKMVKNAAVSELGNAILVGKYLADIIRFTLSKVPVEKRGKAINSVKQRIYTLNEREISMKNLPATSAIGQSITFVKHVLFNHDPIYVREVINNLVRNL